MPIVELILKSGIEPFDNLVQIDWTFNLRDVVFIEVVGSIGNEIEPISVDILLPISLLCGTGQAPKGGGKINVIITSSIPKKDAQNGQTISSFKSSR